MYLRGCITRLQHVYLDQRFTQYRDVNQDRYYSHQSHVYRLELVILRQNLNLQVGNSHRNDVYR